MNTKKFKFSKTNRLQTPVDFQAVFSQPLRVRSPYFTVLARPNSGIGKHARLGLIVPKRIVKQAVQRNAIRRLIRESFRLHQHQLQGLDVIVLLRGALPALQRRVFYECLEGQWKNLIKEWQKSS